MFLIIEERKSEQFYREYRDICESLIVDGRLVNQTFRTRMKYVWA